MPLPLTPLMVVLFDCLKSRCMTINYIEFNHEHLTIHHAYCAKYIYSFQLQNMQKNKMEQRDYHIKVNLERNRSVPPLL